MKSDAMKFIEELNGGPLTFGMVVRAFRTRNDMSQDELAEELGFSKAYVSDIETGRKHVSVHQARYIAVQLGESENHFLRIWMQDWLRRESLEGVFEVNMIGKGMPTAPRPASTVERHMRAAKGLKGMKKTTKKATRKRAAG